MVELWIEGQIDMWYDFVRSQKTLDYLRKDIFLKWLSVLIVVKQLPLVKIVASP